MRTFGVHEGRQRQDEEFATALQFRQNLGDDPDAGAKRRGVKCRWRHTDRTFVKFFEERVRRIVGLGELSSNALMSLVRVLRSTRDALRAKVHEQIASWNVCRPDLQASGDSIGRLHGLFGPNVIAMLGVALTEIWERLSCEAG